MRHINKINMGGTDRLHNQHHNPPNTPQEATIRWQNFNDKLKNLELLLYEQYYLCCYSELRADEEGIGYHIEHIENKSQNPARTFDYTNLAASAFHSDNLKKLPNNVFGGHTVGKRGVNGAVNMNQFISPLQANCADYFVYLSDGSIKPNAKLSQIEQDKAQYTIDILNLDCPFLRTKREEIYKELESLLDKHTDDEMVYWAEIELFPIKHRLSSFFTLRCLFFGNLAEQILASYENDGAIL
ncbi:retron system putative HNH endonuclease [Neisseria cinerea]|uniref:retron system putative HNH endonuclease n=1 Tax=Neisseria cinerea TaxID=483 RepID=UPI000D39C8DA|nr:retron system putative HNH endonuclease [Neisseria cinerea]